MWYSKRKNLLRIRVWLIGKKRRGFNICLKKPLRTYNKRNHLELGYKLSLNPISPRIFGSDTKNHFFKSIGATKSNDATRSTCATKIFSIVGFTKSTSPTENSSILDDIMYQLLENKHTFTLG